MYSCSEKYGLPQRAFTKMWRPAGRPPLVALYDIVVPITLTHAFVGGMGRDLPVCCMQRIIFARYESCCVPTVHYAVPTAAAAPSAYSVSRDGQFSATEISCPYKGRSSSSTTYDLMAACTASAQGCAEPIPLALSLVPRRS